MINFMYVALKNKIESDIKRRVEPCELEESVLVIYHTVCNDILSIKQGEELMDLINMYVDKCIEEKLSKTDKYLIFVGKIN